MFVETGGTASTLPAGLAATPFGHSFSLRQTRPSCRHVGSSLLCYQDTVSEHLFVLECEQGVCGETLVRLGRTGDLDDVYPRLRCPGARTPTRTSNAFLVSLYPPSSSCTAGTGRSVPTLHELQTHTVRIRIHDPCASHRERRP